MKSSTRTVATCGVMGALSAAIMFIGGILPLATYTAPAISGIFLLPVALELGLRSGFMMYAVVSLLSLFVVADKEMALTFIFFLGFYPLLKQIFDKIDKKTLRIVIKLVVFNVCIFSMYSLILYVFPIGIVVNEFAEYAPWFLILLVVLANITFVIYDMALTRITWLYLKKYRSRIMKGRR
ncbi:MAG: hypothetical protein PHG02_05505 [Oscillospiraceae bacterium]|nr:hypothetical protein [Oscillospiraceae bacterium]